MSFARVQQWATFSKTWWLYDAKWQCPFESALVIRKYIQGKHKPVYAPISRLGDIVVVMNSKQIAVEGDYWQRWKHYSDTGYAKGKSATPIFRVHEQDPTKVLWKCVYASQRGNLARRYNMAHLHIYPDENVPEEIMRNISGQIPQVRPVPTRLEEYSAEERAAIPRLFDWPPGHTLNPLPPLEVPYKPGGKGDK